MWAPPWTVVVTVGLVPAREWKTFTLTAPPPELRVLASASVIPFARAMKSSTTLMTPPERPSTTSVSESLRAVEFDTLTAITPPVMLRIWASAALLPWARTSIRPAPAPPPGLWMSPRTLPRAVSSRTPVDRSG